MANKTIEVRQLPDEDHTVTDSYVEIGGRKFDSSIVGLLEALKDTGLLEPLRIRPREVGDALVELGLASRGRGGYYVRDEKALQTVLDKAYDVL